MNPLFEVGAAFEGMGAAPVVGPQYFEWSAQGRPKGFKPAMLGQWMVDNIHFTVGVDNDLYRYVSCEGYYVPSDAWVRAAVALNHGEMYTGRVDNNVLDWLYSRLGSVDQKTNMAAPLPGGLLNVRNGILDPLTLQMQPHSPEFRTCIQIPVEWDPLAVCPAIDKFIGESVPEEFVDLIWEFIGYTLSGTNKYQKAGLLYGPGGNGKTRLLDIMRGLLGEVNFTTMSLHQLAENRFMAADLQGKLANVCGDIGKDKVQHAEIIKNIVGQDPFRVERKFKQGFDLEPLSVLVFSANSFPKVLDATPAFFDRFIVVDMPTVFRNTPLEDPELKNKITDPGELKGALRKAVEGLCRLETRGRFLLPERSIALGKQWRRDSDSRIAFLHELMLSGPPPSDLTVVRKSALYAAYKSWCEVNGLGAFSAIAFNNCIKDAGIAASGHDDQGHDIWKGLAVKTPTFGDL